MSTTNRTALVIKNLARNEMEQMDANPKGGLIAETFDRVQVVSNMTVGGKNQLKCLTDAGDAFYAIEGGTMVQLD